MAYPFPEIKRQIFNWTFLKDVSISFMYHVVASDVNYSELSDFFEKNFSISGIKEGVLGIDKGIRIQSEDKNLDFDFSFNKFELKIRYPLYTDFGKMLSWLPTINSFLGIVKVLEIDQISIRKYNELSFSIPKEDGNVIMAMEEIFSKNLLDENFQNEAKSFTNLNRWERKLMMADVDSSSQVNINYGFCVKDDIKPKNALTLSISVCTVDSPSPVLDIESRLDQMNLIIDRAFRWCMTDSIIEKMKG